jgi:hypothetical protein
MSCESQKKFLESVLTDNMIGYTQDKNNRAWTVSYYLENAKHRMDAAMNLAEEYRNDKSRDKVLPLLRLVGTGDVAHSRYEWECAHAAMRVILKILHPKSTLPALEPKHPYG